MSKNILRKNDSKLKNDLLKAKRALTVQHALGKAFASGVGVEDTIYKILELYCTKYKWKSGIFWAQNTFAGKKEYQYITGWHDKKLKNSSFIKASKKVIFTSGNGVLSHVLKSKKPVWIQNLQALENYERRVFAKEVNLKSAYIIPITYTKDVMGILEFSGDIKTEPLDFIDTIRNGVVQLSHYLKKKETDIQLVRIKQKSETISELAPAIIYTADETGNITSLSPAVEKITGMRREDLIGKPLLSLFCSDNVKEVEQAFEEQRKSSEYVAFEASIITSKNQDLFAEVKEKTRNLGKGRLERIGIIRDVTERNLLEKQKDLWIGIATHELKTPISSIKAFAQILTKKKDSLKNGERARYLHRIDKLTDEMTNLIQDLLDITKIRAGALELMIENVDISLLTKEVMEDVQPVSEHKLVFEGDGRVFINCDKRRIQQVIVNIVSNAIKYSPPKSKVTLSVNEKKDTVLMAVKDEGKGIDETLQTRIFDLFYRGNNKRTGSSGGLGLGLFISKAIVTAHGGKIWVESKVGQGSTFFVEIPR